MSYGLTATLLLRLDGRLGNWEPVAALAAHCAQRTQTVIDELEPLVASGMVRVMRHRHTGVIEAAMTCVAESAPR